jgi:hypothetical protein
VSWEAYGGLNAGGEGSDQQIAVSSTHVGVSGRAAMAFYTKAGTKVYGVTGAEAFFVAQGMPSSKNGYQIFDLRMIFDEYRKRFWVGATERQDRAARSRCICAPSRKLRTRSTASICIGGTRCRRGPALNGDGADYPCIGIAEKVFIQTNKVANGNTYKHWRPSCAIINWQRAAGAADQRLGMGVEQSDGNKTYIIQPTVHHGSSSRVFLVNKWGTEVYDDHALTSRATSAWT